MIEGLSRHLLWAAAFFAVSVTSFVVCWHLVPTTDGSTASYRDGSVNTVSTHIRTIRTDTEPSQLEIASLECAKSGCVSTHSRAPWSLAQRQQMAELGRLEQGYELPAFEQSRPVTKPRTQMVALASAPFPYWGRNPRTNRPFLNVRDDGRRGRRTSSGRVYWADKTYNDKRVLMHIPKGFDAKRPGVIVMFFHGHGATLQRDVLSRQRVPEQISDSGMNAVLLAPQFAVNARDSSAGKFWKPGAVRRFLDEAAVQLAELNGDPKSKQLFAKMPVVIVGYSGGYLPTAAALAEGDIDRRIQGVVLLDGLYGELNTFANWIQRRKQGFFVSSYARSTTRGNGALKRKLKDRKIKYSTRMPRSLRPGSVAIIKADVSHRSYVTRAWTHYPIADVLMRMSGVATRASSALSASLSPALAQ